MAFLKNLDQMRRIEWGRSYHWDIKFTGSDSPAFPFNEFFPAVSVDEQISSLSTLDVDAFGTSLKFPLKSSVKNIQITFLDDKNHTLLTWLSTWVNSTILNNGNYVATLDESVRQLIIQKVDNNRRNLIQTSYWVFPEGPVTYVGNSDSAINQYTVSFVVAGKIS